MDALLAFFSLLFVVAFLIALSTPRAQSLTMLERLKQLLCCLIQGSVAAHTHDDGCCRGSKGEQTASLWSAMSSK
jgi:hypothetical protein